MLSTSLQPVLGIFELFSDGVALVAPGSWRIAFANATLKQWLGRAVPDLAIEDVLRGNTPGSLQSQVERVWCGELADSTVTAGYLFRGGALCDLPAEIRIVRVQFADQKLIALVVRQTEVPKAKEKAGRRDPLTGLADRSELFARLEMLLGGDRLADQRFAVLFIDLDHFKQVNDRYGHLVGDRVLSEVAERLVRCTRSHDQVFRYGGDEFVVLVEQVVGEHEIEPVVARIHAELAQPIAIHGEDIGLSVSVGAAEVSPEHRTAEDVLFDADRAMYAAKRLVPMRIPR